MNYTRAAARLFISRQALRQTIQSMEVELDTVLFDNRHNHLTLTVSGEIVRKYAKKQIDAYEAMLAETHLKRESTIRLGISSSLLPFCTPKLPGFLEEFEAGRPGLKMELSTGPSDSIVEKVTSGDLTAGILTMMSCDLEGITADTLEASALGVTFPATHRFAGMEHINIEDLAGERCLVMGSPEIIMKPLCDALEIAGVRSDFEIVPSAKTAFYRMDNESCIMLEYTYPNTGKLKIEHNRPLAGGIFPWNLTLIYDADNCMPQISMLRDFLSDKMRCLNQ
jgi:protein-tyrosine phosphatase